MTTSNKTTIQYEKFAEEITRLCQVEKQLFKEVLQLPYVFDDSASEKSASKAYFDDHIKDIDNEIQKLEKMEVVIAVVGTMKAGKSTTINAIVGTEVLPNRNAPMTTLPTLIRNVHGQTEPVLKLEKLQPLEELSKQIATKLASLVKAKELEKVDLYNSKDGKELIDSLLKNQCYQFKKSYHGQQAIFSFLKHLNDLMRLAKEDSIQLEPPYSEYENLNDLPVIEIEFFHLKGKEKKAQGSLAILDTPGPNEFGQSEALREVFKKQLAKASAVALVVDYTQMNSQAGGDVVKQVETVTKQLSKNNLYVLVNKFDQADTNSMKTKEEVQEYVVKTLMDKAIEPNQVYPISSQHAYLANRAKHNLELHGKLPDFKNEGWVKDFAQPLMDVLGNEVISNTEIMSKRAETLWTNSLFDEPLNGIIHKAHANAAQESVKSAMKKLVEWHNELKNSCEAFSGAVSENLTAVTEAIKLLQNNINKLQQVKKNIHDATADGVDELSMTLNKLADQNQKSLKDEIEILFKEGKARETSQNAKELQLLIEKEKEKKFGSFADIFLNWKRAYTNFQSENLKQKMAFSASNPIIKYDDKEKAEQLIQDIQKLVVAIFDDLSEQFKEHSGLITSKMADEISSKINEFTADTLKEAQENLNDSSGFQLNFSLPKLELNLNSFDASSAFVGGVDTKSESKRSSYVSNRFTNWLNSDWGRESYPYEETSYQVDTTKIRKSILAHLETYKTSYTNQFKEHLERKLKPAIDEHTKSLEDYLERYQNTFLTVEKANKSMEQADKEQLLKQLDLLIDKNKIQSGDIDVIKNGLEVQS